VVPETKPPVGCKDEVMVIAPFIINLALHNKAQGAKNSA